MVVCARRTNLCQELQCCWVFTCSTVFCVYQEWSTTQWTSSQLLDKPVNNQLTGFLDVYSILSSIQSGFRSGYGCVTIALDSKQHCAAIFIDLAKGFDTVDHSILVGRLRTIGVSEGSLAWFANYLFILFHLYLTR